MLFSKSFGYALKSLLYVAIMQEEHRKVQVDEIATKLALPRHFTGKILKRLVKEKMLVSAKGPNGGFLLAEQTLSLPVFSLLIITDGASTFNNCVLQLKECDLQNPCPLHHKLQSVKETLRSLLMQTSIHDLLTKDRDALLQSLSSNQPLAAEDLLATQSYSLLNNDNKELAGI